MPQASPFDSMAFAIRSETDGSLTPIGDGIAIGRSGDCELCIDQSVVSRLHARISRRGQQLWIEDPGSTNGTFVNDLRVSVAVPIKAGDRLRFDTLAYTIVALPGATPAVVDRDRTVIGMRAVTLPLTEKTADETPAAATASAAPLPPDRASAPPPSPVAPTPISPPPISAPPVVPTPVAPTPITVPVPPPLPTPAPRPTPAPAAASTSGSGGIPASWAEAGQLERASNTMMMSAQLLRALAEPKAGTSGVIAAVRASALEQLPSLIGLNKGIVGQVYFLNPQTNRRQWEIGRDPGADIAIADPSVSGRHAQILLEQNRWKIVNLMSINGSFVNGRKVLSAHLKTGDRIRLGQIELAFDAGGALPTIEGTASSRLPAWLQALIQHLRRWFHR